MRIPNAVRFGLTAPKYFHDDKTVIRSVPYLPIARTGVVDCFNYRTKTGAKRDKITVHEPKEGPRSLYVEIDHEQKRYIVYYVCIGDKEECRDVTGGQSMLKDGWGKHQCRTHYNNLKRWIAENPDKVVERFDWDPKSIAAEGSGQQQQQPDDDDDEQEEVVQQQAPNNNRLNQQVENLRAELEAKNERISELEKRNKELEDQLQYQKADAERCLRRLRLAEARQAGPRHKGREEHEEDEEGEDDEEYFIASGGDDDDADDDTIGVSAAVGVGGALAKQRHKRRGKRTQEEEKKDDEADSSEDGEDSEEDEEEDHQQQRARRGRNGRGGKKKKTGEDDDAGSGNQQDDQVPGGGGQFSFTREEFEAKLETMQARLLAQIRAELADASAADAAAAAAASVSGRVEEQDGDISTEPPAATAVAAVGGEPILGGNTLPQSISTGATAAGTAAAASGANADGRHKRRHETGFAHPASASDSAESSDDDTDGICRRQRRSKRSKVDMMEEFESKAELPQMMKGSAAPPERGEREVEKSTEEEGTAAEDADLWKEATDKASGRPYYYNTATNETTWDKPECLCAAEKKVPASAKATSTSKDLPRGVRFGSKPGEYVAKISRRGTERIIGTFDSAEKASIAYKTVNMYLVENGIKSSEEFLSNLDAARQLARDAVETAGQYV